MKAVFLDIDNTLLDFDEYVRTTMRDGFSHFGLKRYEPWMYDIFTKVNNVLWGDIEKGKLSFEVLRMIRWNKVFEQLDISFDGVQFEEYFQNALNESAIPVEGAYDLLKALKGRYLVCAASNGPYYQQIHRLEICGMLQYFDHVFVSEKAGFSKPAAEFFDYIFGMLGNEIRPADCVMVGDSLSSDIAGGTAYGMKTCWYRRNPAKTADIHTDFIVDHLHEIISVMDVLEK